ncbi:hypothetical protein [Pseudonocardia sp. DSM 110487]|nr:hypothetical protein [Pseudonocardia sp. DSM 110487]
MEINIGSINAEVIGIADTIINDTPVTTTTSGGDDKPTDEVRPQ